MVSSSDTVIISKETSSNLTSNIFLTGSSVSELIRVCTSNEVCTATSCCSYADCVDSWVCLKGLKMQGDICDFNYECGTKCCSAGVCGHYLLCYNFCVSNTDCSTLTGKTCCSGGYCTDDIVC